MDILANNYPEILEYDSERFELFKGLFILKLSLTFGV